MEVIINYEVGDVLHTNNGDFLIVSIESFDNENNNKELCGYGAIYLDKENEYPIEMQFISSNIQELVRNICEVDIYKVLSVDKFDYNIKSIKLI